MSLQKIELMINKWIIPMYICAYSKKIGGGKNNIFNNK